MLGRKIGRYRVIAELGSGGMGTVWKAEDEFLGRIVALKILADDLARSPDARARFIREARNVSALDHPGIATLFEADEADGRLFLAFQLIEGVTLRERLLQGPLMIDEVLRIGVETAEALAHAHARRVIHRDVSPSNIMLANDGRVVLIDFGLARAADAAGITTSNTMIGTLRYMAPEVVLGKPADHRSDIFSLGAVLYEMATGRQPFPGENPATIIYHTVNQEPDRPGALRPDLAAGFDRAILRALSKRPDDRHARIEELARELRELLGKVEPTATVSPRPSGASSERTAIAVLPFTHVDPGGQSGSSGDHFARGLAETLSASLASVPRLQIVPPRQSGAFSADTGLEALARKLGTRLVLAGTTSRSGDRIRVSFSLVDGWQGEQIAGDSVQGTVHDLFQLQDDLLARVIRALRIEGSHSQIRVPSIPSAAAHWKYLQALGHLQRTDSGALVNGGIQILEELVQSEGATALVQAALGRGYLRRFEQTRDMSWLTKSEAACRIALSLDPHATEVLVLLGRLLTRTGRSAEAIAALEEAVQIDADDGETWIAMSHALQAEGRLDDAERAAARAVALRPRHWLAHDRLGLVQFRRGLIEEAVASLKHVVEINPDSAMTWNNLGSAYVQLGRLEEATAAYRRSIEIMPSASALMSLATVLFYTDRRQEAVELLDRAVTLEPRDPRGWGNRGDTQRWVPGQEKASVASFERAIQLERELLATNPRDGEAWSRLGKWLAKQGRIEPALEAIERALELAPEIISIQAYAVTVFHLAGRPERAIEALGRAVDGGYSRQLLIGDPELRSLWQDPRAKELLERTARSA